MVDRKIGVFDSGVGGLTVLRELVKVLPGEDFIYVGDTLRVPYGNRDRETIVKYSLEIVDFLISQDVKAIIIACNTITSVALDLIRSRVDLPVIGVIEPGSISAQKIGGNIGVIATEGTVKSKSYEKALNKIDKDIRVKSLACPKLVEIVEADCKDESYIRNTLKSYLKEFQGEDIRALILGCTHFPVLSKYIEEMLAPNIRVIDPAYETSKMSKRILDENNLLKNSVLGKKEYYVTGNIEEFRKNAEKILGENIVNLDKLML